MTKPVDGLELVVEKPRYFFLGETDKIGRDVYSLW